MLEYIMSAFAKIAEENGETTTFASFVPWADPVADGVRRARGEAAYKAVHGAAPAPPRTTFQGVAELDYLYGEIWSRDEYLTRRDRRLIAISCSAAIGIDAETTSQLESALRSGDLTFDELQEVVVHIAVYLGWIVARRLDHLLVAAANTGTDD
jgi:4-carboxymuconolactone decarboxylase